ncbi:hypothetical protein ISN45_Aa05g028200 [Arabidopsis thaliana x Arabidopsis arenosa]|uniref:Uncharacterized protein n=1 Tax=Arabidopsis thaliana x Arabidopsis arenosa TaxID=1240361 RepID=A0A8T1ZPN0_9BRAS|nr:hypothetical protein ISN45_Aa05g028200 [Arabidopsis thaliana x Arabidopsis arenosa]
MDLQICNHHKVGGGVDRRDGKGGREKASSGFEIQIENYNLSKNFMIPSVFVVSYPHTSPPLLAFHPYHPPPLTRLLASPPPPPECFRTVSYRVRVLLGPFLINFIL